MGVSEAPAEEFTYFCRCDACRCSLFRGDNWYHKPGTNYDLCARDFAKLPEAERQACSENTMFPLAQPGSFHRQLGTHPAMRKL